MVSGINSRAPCWVFPIAQMVKNLPSMQETRVQSLVQEDPLEKGMQSTPVSFPGESYGQRSLGGYNPWGRKELDTTERLNTHMLGLVLRNVESGSDDCSERSGKQYLALDTGE